MNPASRRPPHRRRQTPGPLRRSGAQHTRMHLETLLAHPLPVPNPLPRRGDTEQRLNILIAGTESLQRGGVWTLTWGPVHACWSRSRTRWRSEPRRNSTSPQITSHLHPSVKGREPKLTIFIQICLD